MRHLVAKLAPLNHTSSERLSLIETSPSRRVCATDTSGNSQTENKKGKRTLSGASPHHQSSQNLVRLPFFTTNFATKAKYCLILSLPKLGPPWPEPSHRLLAFLYLAPMIFAQMVSSSWFNLHDLFKEQSNVHLLRVNQPKAPYVLGPLGPHV
jgi:hypothetical protein